jgi:NAD(P)-dependent dehydrogenase (short-subunit alcohol dehydrogenase family)
MAADSATPVALVVGAGDATGGAIARRFARGGYTVCATRRNADKLEPLLQDIRAAGGQAHGVGSDARKEDEVAALFADIENRIGPVEVLVFNIGANVRTSILEESARRYFKIWEMACFAGFLNASEAARRMVGRGKGTILFTGATASTRGREGYAAFAAVTQTSCPAWKISLSASSWSACARYAAITRMTNPIIIWSARVPLISVNSP